MNEMFNRAPRPRSQNTPKLPILKPRKTEPAWQAKHYPYMSLPSNSSIRVISVLPSAAPAISIEEDTKIPIQCTMKVIDLDTQPDYEALSYTWSDPLVFYRNEDDIVAPDEWYKPSYDIICDGHPVSVTANLFAALLARRTMATKLAAPDGDFWAKQMEEMGYPRQEHVWIDAICINQADLAEREGQVSIMARIYSQAAVVNAWLGGEDEVSLDAHPVISSLTDSATRRNFKEHMVVLRGMTLSDPRLYQLLNIPRILLNDWVSLWAFFNRSWFRRAWVVQEMGLARKAVMSVGFKLFLFDLPYVAHMMLKNSRLIHKIRNLGEAAVLPFDEENSDLPRDGAAALASILRPLYRSHETMRWNHNHFLTIGEVRSGFGIEGTYYGREVDAEPFPLRFIVTSFRNTEAKDPRDKIYAFLGICRETSLYSSARDDASTALAPSYQKPVHDVFVDTVRFDVETSKTLDMLSLSQAARYRKMQDLPSWVPDFAAPSYPESLMVSFPDLTPPWNASMGFGEADAAFSTPPGMLHVGGVKFAQVVEVAAHHGFPVPPESHLAKLLEHLPSTTPISSPPTTARLRTYVLKGHASGVDVSPERTERVAALPPADDPPRVSNQPPSEVYWRTMLSDCVAGYYPAPQDCATALEYHMAEDAGDIRHTGVEQNQIHVLAEEIRFRSGVNSFRRQLFRTDGGLLGNGCEDVEVGDEVWILKGASMPMVLRGLGDGRYRFVGEAYVHGVMHGEGIVGRESVTVTLV